MEIIIGDFIFQLVIFAVYKYFLTVGSGAFKFKSKVVKYLVMVLEFALTLIVSTYLGEFDYIYLINVVVLSIIIFSATCYEQKVYLDHLPLSEYNRKPEIFLYSSLSLAMVLSIFFWGAESDVALHTIVITYITSTVSYIASLFQKGHKDYILSSWFENNMH